MAYRNAGKSARTPEAIMAEAMRIIDEREQAERKKHLREVLWFMGGSALLAAAALWLMSL